jgi:hypothetical protein
MWCNFTLAFMQLEIKFFKQRQVFCTRLWRMYYLYILLFIPLTTVVNSAMNLLGSINSGKVFASWGTVGFLRTLLCGVRQGERCREGWLKANRTTHTPGFTWVQKEVFSISCTKHKVCSIYSKPSPTAEAIYEIVPARKGSLSTSFAYKNTVLYSRMCQTHYKMWDSKCGLMVKMNRLLWNLYTE